MAYIVNVDGEDFRIIMFSHDSRVWEIICDKSDTNLDELVYRRTSELGAEFDLNGSYDFSDLIVDYRTTKKEDNIWQ